MAVAIKICRSPAGRASAKGIYSSVKRFIHTENITYEIKPERLQQIEKSPSGWVPPDTEKPDLPFFIKRSKYNNLPVYTDFKSGGTRHITIIRRITGDLKALDNCLKHHLGNDVITQINELTSQVKIRGLYKDEVVTLLKQLGY
ncbi:54S ribosomal protein L49, mitochondrial [Desmophyllum pertusum]|uniref:Large ribosomal subunit protein mL49 n=1 Tax=Desmophyllum pertusum TaxID=174260 RepID=A0A9X0CV13_9CNID|nr:54S ribosomal protein L49, mitochondrial [Desmophyllum pertusum]